MINPEYQIEKLDTKLKKNIFYYINILLISYPMFYPAKALLGHLGQYSLFAFWLLLVILQRPNFIAVILKESFFFLLFLFFLIIKFISSNIDLEVGYYSPLRQISQFLLLYVYFIFGLWHFRYSSSQIKRKLIQVFSILIFYLYLYHCIIYP